MGYELFSPIIIFLHFLLTNVNTTTIMNVVKRNDASIYCLSSGPLLPEWMGERARRNLSKRDESVRRRVELLQDFQMPASSCKITPTADGRCIMVAGTYPPRIRCYDVHELSLKFERYLNAHVVDMVMLGDDYGKMALLLEDRTIAFHAPYGAHESVRIPTFGRAMAYEPSTCELLIAAKGNQVYRLNLEEGRFAEPWTLDNSSSSSAEPTNNTTSATCLAVSPTHPLTSVGCDDGMVRFWDSRSSDTMLRPFLKLDVQSATVGYGYADDAQQEQQCNTSEISSIAHDPSGMYMAAGTAGGIVALYDVRSSRPLHIMEHKHGTAIHTVRFHPGSGCILSSDEKLIKIWRYKSTGDLIHTRVTNHHQKMTDQQDKTSSIGSIVTNVEGSGKFSHFIVAGDEADPCGYQSGLLLCATDQPKMESFFIPAVGLAPKWCSFLENITEELEERDLTRDGGGGGGPTDVMGDGQENIYENYKFVSREELEKLGVSNLIGTPLLRGYMHGFFMSVDLYNRVRAVANPFEYEEYRKKKLKERLEAKRSSRIAPKEATNKKVKTPVNPDLADRLLEKSTTKAGKVAHQLLSDERFGHLFTNPDYQIDQSDDNFKLRNPSGIAATKKRKNDLDSDEEDNDDAAAVDEEADESNWNEGQKEVIKDVDIVDDASVAEDDDSDSDLDGFRGVKVGESSTIEIVVNFIRDANACNLFLKVRGEAYDQMKQLKRQTVQKRATKKKEPARNKVMLEAADVVDAGLMDGNNAQKASQSLNTASMTLAERLSLQQAEESVKVQYRVTREGGAKEATFIPKSGRKKKSDSHDEDGADQAKRKRRGVKELGFKTPFRIMK